MNSIIKLFSIALCFLSFSLFAQTDSINKKDAAGKKQGHWIKMDDNRKKMYDGHFVNDVPVGKFTYYYDNGIPWSETVFTKNGKVAYSKMFDAGGKMMGEGKYIDQKKDSLWKFYDTEGNLLSDEFYVNGVKHGNCKIYYPGNKIAEEKIWKNGILEGPCKKYFESGQLKYLGQYVNNKIEGKAVFYNFSGKVNAEGMYKNDLKEGDWKYYKEDGTLEKTYPYLEGRYVGKSDPDVISKEQQDKEKKQFENYEIKNPYEEGYAPPH